MIISLVRMSIYKHRILGVKDTACSMLTLCFLAHRQQAKHSQNTLGNLFQVSCPKYFHFINCGRCSQREIGIDTTMNCER